MSQSGDWENEHIVPILTDVVVSSKTSRRFYELIALLLALNKGYNGSTGKKGTDLPYVAGENSDESLFHNFVSRLGQICDSRPGGSTVTAFAVLQHPDKVQYVFGSNRRTNVELETTKGYITAILASLRDSWDCEDDEQREKGLSNLLRDILGFNRERIQRYLNGLTAALETCIAICETDKSSIGVSQQKSFDHMRELVVLANQRNNDDDEFLEYTEELIVALQSLQKPVTARFLQKKASNEEAGNTEPWRNLQHHSSRLLAYRRAAEALWDSGSTWPNLTGEFEVIFIPSSIKTSNPLNTSPQTASEILTRVLTSSVETKGEYLANAETLQQNFELNELIEKIWTNSSFRPIVHAEILVHSWLQNTGGTRPERFFGNWQYIGGSKPLCKLCHYYFSNHPSGVQTRGTHGNLYQNWMIPDSADVYGLRTIGDALLKRHEILQGISGRLRKDILRTLSEKVADSRPCDSNTISSFTLNNFLPGVTIRGQKPSTSRTHANSSEEAQSWNLVGDRESVDGESETTVTIGN